MRRALALALLLGVLCAVPCSGWRGSGSATRGPPQYNGKGRVNQNSNGYSGIGQLGAPAAASSSVRRGLGLSAWGIISIILTFIFACMGFYYFSMCYPLLCKKERKYDMIERETVAV